MSAISSKIFRILNSYALLVRLKRSRYFDSAEYRDRYPDVRDLGIDPAWHYVFFGAYEGRLANKRFDPNYYLSQLDSPIGDQPPFFHFLIKGEKMGLKPFREWSSEPWWSQISLSEAVGELKFAKAIPSFFWGSQSKVSLVVPVFNALTELQQCVTSLMHHSYGIDQVIFINDCSTDPNVLPFLQKIVESWPKASLHLNAKNLGFSGTVNRGFALAGNHDVIILNSDTVVSAGWVTELKRIAYSEKHIASVTPTSNNAGVFSLPSIDSNPVLDIRGVDVFACLLRQADLPSSFEVPTGHGFCIYLRRDAIQEIGLFDAGAFPKGYGEENDWCMRAKNAGWRNLFTPKVFVFHHRSASFGDSKNALMEAGRKVIDQRYPEYKGLVSECFSSDAFKELRQNVDTLVNMSEEAAKTIRPRLLTIISTRTGGTPQTNEDLMQAVSSELESFVLHCDGQLLTLYSYHERVYTEVETVLLDDAVVAFPHTSVNYDEHVASWLCKWSIDIVHIRHIAWHSLNLPKVAKALDISVINSFHDFYTVCPTVKLLDEQLSYCGGTCTEGSGQCKHELWPEGAISELKHQNIKKWQLQFESFLSSCDAFITTNSSAKELLQGKYLSCQTKPFQVIEHGRDFATLHQLAATPSSGGVFKILVPGNISTAKGGLYLEKLSEQFKGSPVEFHVMGDVESSLVFKANVICHGAYSREQFAQKVAEISPSIGMVLSIWPETWCHTLTEMWSVGLPVIGFDIGAIGERIRSCGGGWPVSVGDERLLFESIEHAMQVVHWDSAVAAVKEWQANVSPKQSTKAMGQAYLELYQQFVSYPLLRSNSNV